MLDSSFGARTLAQETSYTPVTGGKTVYVPQKIAIFAQGTSTASYPTTKRRVYSSSECGSLYGFGGPAHFAANSIFTALGGPGAAEVWVYPLDQVASGTASTGSIIVTVGSITKTTIGYVTIAGVRSRDFYIAVGDTATTLHAKIKAAIDALAGMPVTTVASAGSVALTSKWRGTTANDITVSITIASDAGISAVVTQPSGGTGVPDITAPLALIANDWVTFIVNGAGTATSELDEYKTWGEGRWSEFTQKPCVVVSYITESVMEDGIAITSTRKLDRTNSINCKPGALQLPITLAAAAVRAAVLIAISNPARDYGGQVLVGVNGDDTSDYWEPLVRDTAFKAGLGTVDYEGGQTVISDMITCWHPDDEDPPGFRYVNDIVKLQQVLYNCALRLKAEDYKGCILINSDDESTNPYAKKTSDVATDLLAVIFALVKESIATNYAYTKAGISVTFPSNRRISAVIPFKLSGNGSVVAVQLAFSFDIG